MLTMARPPHRILLAIGALLCVIVLGSCAPETGPLPRSTTSPLASESDAFKAAENVYREYVTATNHIDLADADTLEPVYALSSGSFLETDQENFNAMHRENYTLTGNARIISFEGLATEKDYSIVTARVCLDVSQVQITDSSGASLVNPQRPDMYPLKLTFVTNGQHELLIDALEVLEADSCG